MECAIESFLLSDVFLIKFSDNCYPERLFCVQDIHTYHCGGFGQEIGGTQGQIQKIQKGVARTLASYIDTFYFTSKNYRKSHRKRGGHGPPWSHP